MKITDEHMKRVLQGDAFLLFDGAFGTMLQRAGLVTDAPGELLNLTAPDKIAALQHQYVEAGSQVITTNTFNASRLHLGDADTVARVFEAAVDCARAAGAQYVAADIGPLGQLLEPYGDLFEDEAYELFAEQTRPAGEAGADLVIIETMADINEALIALKAAQDTTDLPVFVTMTFGESGRTFMGATPHDAAVALCGAGADAIGINCSLGPLEMAPLLRQMREVATVPLIAQANAGLPQVGDDGAVTYPFSASEYAQAVGALVDEGATVIGGCCGTDPSYIAALVQTLDA